MISAVKAHTNCMNASFLCLILYHQVFSVFKIDLQKKEFFVYRKRLNAIFPTSCNVYLSNQITLYPNPWLIRFCSSLMLRYAPAQIFARLLYAYRDAEHYCYTFKSFFLLKKNFLS